MNLNDIDREAILAYAACKLYVHRNTVLYRLNKLRQKTGLEPHCFYDLIKLVEMASTDTQEDIR